MDFYFYGTSRSLEDQDNFLNVVPNYLQTELNRYPSTAIGPDGQSYNVEFVVRGYVITEADALSKAKSNVGKNYDPKVNFVRVDNGKQRHSSSMNALDFIGDEGFVSGTRNGLNPESPDNSIFINTNDMYTTSWLHEVVAHQLGSRRRDSHIRDWLDKNNPSTQDIASIRTVSSTRNIPTKFLDGDMLDLNRRQILPEDKSIMLLRYWKKDENEVFKGVMGASTNTIFDINGNQYIYDEKGNPKKHEKRN